MSSSSVKKLKRHEVGGLPLVANIIHRLGLRSLLKEALPSSTRESVATADILTLLVINLSVARDPLYELEAWIETLDLRPLGFAHQPNTRLTDDRFGRALDKLYDADRASLQTQLVLAALKAFDIKFEQIHNDSTSIKACGKIPGQTRTGLELRQGYSKDHRPDLKQLVFSLSISADGAVPVHHCVYPGNTNDDTTHIATWNGLFKLHGRPDFIYVADGKLCTRSQLAHIANQGGRAITILPQPRNEAKEFLASLRDAPISKKSIWRRPKPCKEKTVEYFSLFDGQYRMEHGDYPIHWFVSSEKRKRDRYSREQRISKAEKALDILASKINKPRQRLSKSAPITKAYETILQKYQVNELIDVSIATHFNEERRRARGRPPGEKVKYRITRKIYYVLHWEQNTQALKAERRVDGVFPLLCTDENLDPREVLKAWKYQPRLEKRFEQLEEEEG